MFRQQQLGRNPAGAGTAGADTSTKNRPQNSVNIFIVTINHEHSGSSTCCCGKSAAVVADCALSFRSGRPVPFTATIRNEARSTHDGH